MSSTGSTVSPYRFGAAWGYITDTPGSGLLQLGARFYWPEVGRRFVQQDPAGDGMNWYAYAGSNPLVWVDLDGLRRRRGVRQWLRDQGRGIRDAIDGLGDMIIAPFTMDPANLPTFSQRNPGLGDLQRCIGRGEGFDAPAALTNNVIKPLMWFTAGAAAAAAGELEGGRRPSLKDLRSPQQEEFVALLQSLDKTRTPISAEEAAGLMDQAKQLGYEVVHEPMGHASRAGWSSTDLHLRIGKYHIHVRTP
jgi:RHS repeat-associated protein